MPIPLLLNHLGGNPAVKSIRSSATSQGMPRYVGRIEPNFSYEFLKLGNKMVVLQGSDSRTRPMRARKNVLAHPEVGT